MKKLATVAMAASLGLFVTSQAAAQEQEARTCATRGEALSHLSDKYAEAPIAMGLTNKGAVIEVLTNKARTTWTIIITMPNGVSCMVAAGEGWELVKQVAAGPNA